MTKSDIEKLGWKHEATARNGGSLIFAWIDGLTTLTYHGDNFILENKNEIEINIIDVETLDFTLLYKGICLTTKKLTEHMENLGYGKI